jgi:hypothetical protein
VADRASDETGTRDALQRAAQLAAAQSRPPDLPDIVRRVNRRRTRTMAGAGLAVAALFAVPALIAANGTARDSGPAAAPTAQPGSPATAAGVPRPSGPSSPAGSVGLTQQPTTETRTVRIYLLKPRDGDQCPEVVPVLRDLEPADGMAKQALRALLNGPTDAERIAGYTSAFEDDASRFQYLKLDGTQARADFTDLDGVLEPQEACRKVKVLEPMRQTLEQFDWIDEARFSIRGDQQAFYVGVLHDRVPN